MAKYLSLPQSLKQFYKDLEEFYNWRYELTTDEDYEELFNNLFNNPSTEQKQLIRGLSPYDKCILIYGSVPEIILESEEFDPENDDKQAKRISRRINRNKLQFNDFPNFIPYEDFPEVYSKVKLGGIKLNNYVIQRCYPYSIYSLKTKRYLTIGYSSNYPSVSLSDNEGKRKTKRIHIIVGHMFLPNSQNKRIIDHRFGNHNDWRLILGLRFATDSENGKNKHSRDDLMKFTTLPEHYQEVKSYITTKGNHSTTHLFKDKELYYSKVDNILMRNLRLESKIYREIDCSKGNATQLTDKEGNRVWMSLNVLAKQI